MLTQGKDNNETGRKKDKKKPQILLIASIYWLVPCSSRVAKYETIIHIHRASGKPADGIQVITIQGIKTALLFQDMFPVADSYIEAPYIHGGQEVRIADPKVIADLKKNAKKVLSLLRHGVRFTPTQPDIFTIETLMLNELRETGDGETGDGSVS